MADPELVAPDFEDIEIEDEAAADADEAFSGSGFGAALGGDFGDLADPGTWVDAITDAAQHIFDVFDAQRASNADPCYRAAFLQEISRDLGSRVPLLRAREASLKEKMAVYEWGAEAWGLGAAAVLAADIYPGAWNSLPALMTFSPVPFPGLYPIADNEQRVQVLGTFLPPPEQVNDREPSSWTTNYATPTSSNRYAKIGPGVFFDRERQELRGPTVSRAYDTARESRPPLEQLLGPNQAASLAQLSALIDEIQTRTDAARDEVAETWALCTDRQAGEIERDQESQDKDRGAGVLLAFGLLAVLGAAMRRRR